MLLHAAARSTKKMGKKTVLDVKVKDVEKRRYPTKHYVSYRLLD